MVMEKHYNNESIESKIIDDGVKIALEQVTGLPSRKITENELEKENFLKSSQSKETLAFHNINHTMSVIDRFEKIINFLKKEKINVGSERDQQIGKLGASFHDTVQDFIENKEIEPDIVGGNPNPYVGYEKIMRKRMISANERASADCAITYMREVNKMKPNTFTKRDEEIIRKQIDVTIPGFDPKAGTVIQPKLDQNSQSSVIDKALALADLGTAGMENPDIFIAEGDNLFREENLDILDAIYAIENGIQICNENKAYYKHRMLGWSKSQPVFATGRKNLFDKEVGCFPQVVQKKLKEEIFNKFDSSIEAIKEIARKRENMTFEEIARDMGYEI